MADVLGRAGDKSYAPNLVSALGDRDDAVRKTAAVALGLLKNMEVVPSLIKGLVTTEGWRQGVPAYIDALVAMGPMVVEPLLKATAELRIGLSRYASGGYKPDAMAYTPKDYYYTSDEFYWPGFYDDRVEVMTKLGPSTMDMMTKYLTPKTNAAVHVLITRSLVQFRETQAIDLLCRIAQQDIDPVRWLAVGGLRGRPPDKVAGTLIAILKSDKDPIVRHQAAEVIGSVKAVVAVDQLCASALHDPTVEVRRAAIVSLGLLRDSRAISTLGQIVFDAPDDISRELAATAMGEIGSDAAVEYLLSALGSDGVPAVRSAAAQSLPKLGSQRARGPLEQVAKSDPDESVRESAKAALSAWKR
jgi:HEAT repeat protein